jgi:uncharacterized membrane protein YeaQ/YmgE (transglycosylase-associated protein family)
MASLRKIVLPLSLLTASCLPAVAQGYGSESSFPGFDSLVHLLGYDAQDSDHRDLMALMLLSFGLFFGYFAHLGFRESGFGIVLNGVVGLVGSSLALYVFGPKFNLLSHFPEKSQDFVLAVLVAGAAVPTLMLASKLANLRRRKTVDFFFNQSRRRMYAARDAKAKAELPAYIVDLLKK